MKKALAIVMVIIAICLCACESLEATVTKITAETVGENKIEINIAYKFPMGGYSVRNVPMDEGEYSGDGMGDYDGALGKYRIMIRFGDLELADEIKRQLNAYNVIENSQVELRTKIVHPEDHGFVLYIGSDTPIVAENPNSWDLSGVFGEISIPIALNATEAIDIPNAITYENYAALPLLDLIEILGLEITYSSEDRATFVCGETEYEILIDDKVLTKVGDNYNYLIPAPGNSNFVCDIIDGELMVDDNTVKCLFNTFLEYPIRLSVDYETNSVVIIK